MAHFYWIHPDYCDLAAQHRLTDLSSLMAYREGTVLSPRHRRRDVIRLELATRSGEPAQLYLKREWDVRWKYIARQALRGRGFWTPLRNEFEVLMRLAAAGVHGPRPVLCLQRLGFQSQSCLLLEAIPNVVTLNNYLATTLRGAPASQREAFFGRLGIEVARLHACGVHQPRLFSNQIYLTQATSVPLSHNAPPPPGTCEGGTTLTHAGNVSLVAAPPQIGFWGFRRALLFDPLPLPRRVEGLAAMLATLPRRLASPEERAAFFDAYLQHTELDHRGMEMSQAVSAQVEQLLTHRKIWEIRESDTEEHRSVRPLESVEAGQMWIDREFRTALESAGLNSFEHVMETNRGKLLRRLPDRENWRLELHLPHGNVCGAYLKKHHIRTPATRLRAWMKSGGGRTAGRVEAQNVARLARSGIAAMKLIAYGEKLHVDGLLESFVLTEELRGYTQLDHFLEKRFAVLPRRQCTSRDHDLLKLIGEVASVAAKFHRLGYNHRDLYCCHFFIKESQRAEFKVNLIDLQRVEHRRHFRSRWLVKDLAQLAYSAPTDRISRTHKMAFIKKYLGVGRLRPQDKRFIRHILAKQRWIDLQVRKRAKGK